MVGPGTGKDAVDVGVVNPEVVWGTVADDEVRDGVRGGRRSLDTGIISGITPGWNAPYRRRLHAASEQWYGVAHWQHRRVGGPGEECP